MNIASKQHQKVFSLPLRVIYTIPDLFSHLFFSPPLFSSFFFLQDFISTKQLNRESIQKILDASKKMKELVESQAPSDLLKGKVLANMFLESSTRTHASFHSGINKNRERGEKGEK